MKSTKLPKIITIIIGVLVLAEFLYTASITVTLARLEEKIDKIDDTTSIISYKVDLLKKRDN